MRARTFWLLIVALVGLRVAAVGGLLVAVSRETDAELPGDVWRYHEIATAPGVPYRDFEVEYPPVTLFAIEALDVGGVRATTIGLMWSQLALDLGIAALIGWAWSRRAALAYLIVGLPFVVFPFVYLRLDLLSVALAVGGLALARRGHERAGGAVLAVACFAKIWPLVVVPVLVVRRAWRSLSAFAVVAAAGLLAWVAWGGTDGPRQVLTFRGARGWEIESVGGAIAREISDLPAHLIKGAYRTGDGPGWMSTVLLVIGLATALATWILASRVPADDDGALDGVAPIAAITATLAAATIISPQYVSWLLPFAAIALVNGESVVAALVVVVSGLTVLEYALFDDVVLNQPLPVAVLMIRNALLVVLLIVCIVRLARLATPVVKTHPARAA